jgi:spermidine/putrescine transport system permease protein
MRKILVGLSWGWLGIFALLPLMMLFVVSFFHRGVSEFFVPGFTLENYIRLFDPIYFTVFFKSLILAVITTIFCLLLGYPFAYFMASYGKSARSYLMILVIIPFWTSSLIRTYATMLILRTNGLLNTILLKLGIISQPMEILYTEWAVYIGMVYTLLPFMILPLYSAVEKLDRQYLQAASDLGASPWQTFVKVTLPLTLPGIIAGSMLVFLPAMGLFYIPDILGGAKSLVVGSFIKNQFLAARNWPFGAAISVFLCLLMGAGIWLYFWVKSRVSPEETKA